MSTVLNKNYWYINGKPYDLNDYVDRHPGGKELILLGKGRECTELFNSMHSAYPGSLDTALSTLSRYQVDETRQNEELDESLFTWNADGLHATVRDRFHKDVKNPKADTTFWCVAFSEIALHLFLIYQWIFNGSLIAALSSGFVSASLGFMLFHTGGHSGLSKFSPVNRFWYKTYGNYVLGFFSGLWDVHHNYGHHCYTNIYRKDPDVINSSMFIRKNLAQRKKLLHSVQWITAFVLLIFLPNQWLGQVIQYYISRVKKKVFGVPLVHSEKLRRWPYIRYVLMCLSIMFCLIWNYGFIYAFLSMYLYSFGLGFAYWACVFPNHDTYASKQSTIKDVQGEHPDWGVHQITHSSNVKMPYWLSYITGGMNYQIEHHLFPSVHPRHYPKISSIVAEECKSRGIQYKVYPTWFHAFADYVKHLWILSK
jgi:fatty acid desaturase